ncbi:MAG: hypothetical protein D6739_08840, partial [Nitrospirae bacterium]
MARWLRRCAWAAAVVAAAGLALALAARHLERHLLAPLASRATAAGWALGREGLTLARPALVGPGGAPWLTAERLRLAPAAPFGWSLAATWGQFAALMALWGFFRP